MFTQKVSQNIWKLEPERYDGKMLVLYSADLFVQSPTLHYGSLSLPGMIFESRARGTLGALPDVSFKKMLEKSKCQGDEAICPQGHG